MIIGEPGIGAGTNNLEGSPHEVITFIIAKSDGIQYPHHNPIIVTLNIDDCNVHCVLVDMGSSVDVLFYDAFLRMKIALPQLKRVETLLAGFEGRSVPVEGIIILFMIVGTIP